MRRIACSRASLSFIPRCMRNISAICQPTGKTGFSDDNASWKIIETSGPRVRRRWSSGIDSRSWPQYRMCPPGMTAGGESRMPMMACAVTDLPEPDSPRIASVSPEWRSKDTPLMASATPSRVRNSTCNWSTSSSKPSRGFQAPRLSRISTVCAPPAPSDDVIAASSSQSRIEGVAHHVSQHDEGQHCRRQEDARKEQQVRRSTDQPDGRGLRDLDPPRDGGRLQADAQEGQGGLDRDVGAEIDGGHHDHRGQRVGQDVRADDPPWRRAQSPRRLDVVVRLHLKHTGSHQPAIEGQPKMPSTKAIFATETTSGSSRLGGKL